MHLGQQKSKILGKNKRSGFFIHSFLVSAINRPPRQTYGGSSNIFHRCYALPYSCRWLVQSLRSLVLDLKRVDIKATKQKYITNDSPQFKARQAEVLVKTFIPLDYIINLENELPLHIYVMNMRICHCIKSGVRYRSHAFKPSAHIKVPFQDLVKLLVITVHLSDNIRISYVGQRVYIIAWYNLT